MPDIRNWTPQQKQCIDDRGGTILVSAAAGSGKTAVLVNRLVGRITDTQNPVDVDRLLVVTFTNAAAAEMKQRIAKELTKLLKDDPQNVRLQRQQLALPRASISTIHSFCIDLLRSNSYLLNISPQFKIGDQQQLLLLRREALKEVIEEFYGEATPEFSELTDMLSNGKHDERLNATVDTIYEFIQSYPHPEEWLEFAKTFYDTGAEPADTPWGRLVLSHLIQTFDGFLSVMRYAASLCGSDEQLCLNYLPSLQADVESLTQLVTELRNTPDWDGAMAKAFGWNLTPLKSIKKPTDVAAQDRVKALRETVSSSLKTLRSVYCGTAEQCVDDIAVTRRLVSVLYDIVARFSKRFTEKKNADHLLDFNDLEHLALQLLTERTESGNYVPGKLAQELSLQFDEIMVDEYQDTNATQNEIFKALSRNESNLFFVGDVKQSIYGFRQARPELFIHRRTSYAPYDGVHYPATITLGNNFRSRHEVTDTVNFLFRQLMSKEVGGLPYGEAEELKFSATGYPLSDCHETECLIVDRDSAKDAEVSSDIAEARVIAKRIRELHGTLSVTKDGVSRPADYGDFCILLRAKQNHADVFRKELERLGIPVTVDADSAFFSTAEIRLALSLLRAIDNPTLDIPLAAVLLSPLFGFSPDDLAYIRRTRTSVCLYSSLCAARTDTRRPALAKRCADCVAALQRYRTLAATLTVDTLLRRLYEETALPDLMATRNGGKARRENLQMLYDHCAKFEQNGFRGLSAFIRYVDRLQEQRSDLPSAVVSDTQNAVHIMSIHGSKGLEFPVVFLARLDAGFNNGSSQNNLLLHPQWGAALKRRDPHSFNRFATLPYRGLSLAIRNSDHAEEMRILYVALTRAREKLILVTCPTAFEKRLATFAAGLGTDTAIPLPTVYSGNSYSHWILTALLRHPDGDELRRAVSREDLPVLPAEAPCRITFCQVPEEDAAVTNEEKTAVADPETVAAIRERMAYEYPHKALARIPSKMAASDSAHKQTAHRFIARSRPAFLSHSGLTPTERGTAIHTFMQFALYDAAARSTADEALRLVNGGFLTSEQAGALDHKKLSAFFRSDLYRRMASSNRMLREYHFTCRRNVAEEFGEEFTVIQGIADCVFEENGSLVIVDYKTDRVKTAGELEERYRSQLAIYRDALAEALGMPVKECLLYSFELGCTVTVNTVKEI